MIKSICAFAAALTIVSLAAGGSRGSILPGSVNDGKTSIAYDALTGEITILPEGEPVGLFQILSASNIFTGTANLPPFGLGFDVNTAGEKAWAALPSGAFNQPFSLGRIAPTGLSQPFLLNDLSAVGSGGLGTPNRDFDLVSPPLVPPLVVDANLGLRDRSAPISHQFNTVAGTSAITWRNLMVSGPGTPTIAPTLSSSGLFNWDPAGSLLGQYNFDVTATNAIGGDVGRLSLSLVDQLPIPPTVIDAFAVGEPGDKFVHTFQSAGDPPFTWSALESIGPGAPMIHPTLSPIGVFAWDSTGSPAQVYIFHVTATSAVGSDTGQLVVDLTFIPEPSTATLLLLPLAGLVCTRALFKLTCP